MIAHFIFSLLISIDALVLHINPVLAFSNGNSRLHPSRTERRTVRFANNRSRRLSVRTTRANRYAQRHLKLADPSSVSLLMSEESNEYFPESNTTQSDTKQEVKSESGWVTNFKYLLPSSFRSKSTDSDVDVSTFNPNSRDSDPIFLEASSFNDQKEEECPVEDDGVIDVECYVEEVRDEKNSTVADTDDGFDQDLLAENDETAGQKRNWFQRLFRSDGTSDMQTTNFNATLNETSASDTQSTEEAQHDQTFDDASNTTSTKDHRRKRHNKPIFHNLETSDIDSTMQSKQRKWSRRRKRAAILVHTIKNACFLFVVTFLAGNVMNQFVDLDEDGSFEVHFGKALSSSTPSANNVDKTVSIDRAGRMERRRPVIRSRPSINQDDSQPLGLVSQAVQKVGPAVVRVETETDVMDSDVTNSNGDEDRGDIFDGIPEAPPQSDDKMIDFGQGSGIIIRINDEFHILTNAHVIDGASRINVLLTDGRRFKAELTGSDDIMDVAVLKILPEFADSPSDMVSDLPVADLGDSDRLEVGTFVTAIGSPGGLDNSCTIGIVSGLKRCPKAVGIPDKAGVLQYIQTDAAINVGNSGGPLVDVESGDIIGINTCIRANMEGTSFAIPINKVMGILDDLYEGRHITHGYLGVQMSTMNPTLARYHNKMQAEDGVDLPEKDGVMIEKVFKKSPAEAGGLKKYDFVSKIDGQQVTNADDAHLVIDQAPIGQDLSLTIVRGDKEIVVQVKPEDLSVRLKQLREERLKRKKTKA